MVGVALEVLGQPMTEQALHLLYRQRRVAGDRRCPAFRFGHELVVVDDLVDEAELERAFCVQVLPEERDLAGLGPAQETWQLPGAAALRDHAHLSEPGHQLRRRSHQPQIAA